MLFGYLTLATALFISSIAAYYAILGLTMIFPVMKLSVMIMGLALELGKIIAAVWLHKNWLRTNVLFKLYLIPCVAILMCLTAMGTFGFLSKSHGDQTLVSGDATSKIALYDEKIRIAKENIDADRAALKQLDASVDQILSRTTTELGAERSVQIRRQQGPERARLLRDIETEQKKIAQLNEERAPIAAEVRKVEAEVGPVKYLATVFYGSNPNQGTIQQAVILVIILIVAVLDPLALVLILAGTKHLELEKKSVISASMYLPSLTSTSTSSTSTSSTSTSSTSTSSTSTSSTSTSSTSTSSTTTTTTTLPPDRYLFLPFKSITGQNFSHQVEQAVSSSSTTTASYVINNLTAIVNGKQMSLHVFKNLYPELYLDNLKKNNDIQ